MWGSKYRTRSYLHTKRPQVKKSILNLWCLQRNSWWWWAKLRSLWTHSSSKKERLNTLKWELLRESSVPIASTKASPTWRNLHRYMSTPSASSSTLLLAYMPFYSSHASLEYCVTRNIDVRSVIMKSKRTLYSLVWMTVSSSSTLVNLECLLQNESWYKLWFAYCLWAWESWHGTWSLKDQAGIWNIEMLTRNSLGMYSWRNAVSRLTPDKLIATSKRISKTKSLSGKERFSELTEITMRTKIAI